MSHQSPLSKDKTYAVSIWPQGLGVNAVAAQALGRGEDCLEAVEAALRVSEDDTTDHSTGWGGFPNAAGEVELDAAIMFGPGARAGAVGGLKATHYAISVARRVMEKTPHVLLVGDAAQAFARRQGFPEFNLLTEESRLHWEEWKSKKRAAPGSHDTMATLAIDYTGQMAVGCTTSGQAFKLPGRVGDSPIIGAGLYVDQKVGAAAGTGLGEEIMRVCASFLVVEMMRRGEEPQAACEQALRRLLEISPTAADKPVALAALRADGRPGGASLQPGFAYAFFDGVENRLFPVTPLRP